MQREIPIFPSDATRDIKAAIISGKYVAEQIHSSASKEPVASDYDIKALITPLGEESITDTTKPLLRFIGIAQLIKNDNIRTNVLPSLEKALTEPSSYWMRLITETAQKTSLNITELVFLAEAQNVFQTIIGGRTPESMTPINGMIEILNDHSKNFLYASKLVELMSGESAFNFERFSFVGRQNTLDDWLTRSGLDRKYWNEFKRNYAANVINRLVAVQGEPEQSVNPLFQRNDNDILIFLRITKDRFDINFSTALGESLIWLGDQKPQAVELICDKVIREVTLELARELPPGSKYKSGVRSTTLLFLTKLGLSSNEQVDVFDQIPNWKSATD